MIILKHETCEYSQIEQTLTINMLGPSLQGCGGGGGAEFIFHKIPPQPDEIPRLRP